MLNRRYRTPADLATARTAALGLGILGAALLACGGGTGVTQVDDPSTGESTGQGGGAYFKARCKSDVNDCLAEARAHCGDQFTVVHKESHAGGLLADALPGPVTWYSVTFRCGVTGDVAAEAAQEEALRAFVMLECRTDWSGRCGLLADQLEFGATIDASPLAIENAAPRHGGGMIRAAANECGQSPETITESCRATFRQRFMKRLRDRYPRATDARLHSWCANHAPQCDPSRPDLLRVLEQDYLGAHDDAVFAAYKDVLQAASNAHSRDIRQGDDQSQRTDEEQRIRETRAQMVDQVVESMNRPRTTVNVNVQTNP